jgi:hypothetical protein
MWNTEPSSLLLRGDLTDSSSRTDQDHYSALPPTVPYLSPSSTRRRRSLFQPPQLPSLLQQQHQRRRQQRFPILPLSWFTIRLLHVLLLLLFVVTSNGSWNVLPAVNAQSNTGTWLYSSLRFLS